MLLGLLKGEVDLLSHMPIFPVTLLVCSEGSLSQLEILDRQWFWPSITLGQIPRKSPLLGHFLEATWPTVQSPIWPLDINCQLFCLAAKSFDQDELAKSRWQIQDERGKQKKWMARVVLKWPTSNFHNIRVSKIGTIFGGHIPQVCPTHFGSRCKQTADTEKIGL